MAVAVINGALTKAQAARVYAVCQKIVSRWVERFRQGGRAAKADRSSRPNKSPRQIDAVLRDRIATLRRQRVTGKHIALETGVSPATVSRVLKRASLSRMKDIAPTEPVVRYEYAEPDGLIHLDIKPRSLRAARPPDHWRQDAPEQFSWRRLRIRPCSA